MAVEEIRGDAENFPAGLRVLAVDDDLICLKLIETLLRKCQYHVTTTSQARVALEMLRENEDRFDLVISDVHMPDMDGFRLLELVGLEMDLPVIMLSANSDPKLVMKGVTHGACDYLVKPVRIEELRNIWQHVVRRRKADAKNKCKSSDQTDAHLAIEGHGSPLTGSSDQNGKLNRKRKDEEDESEDNGNEGEDPATQKKPRVVWSIELHRKFVAAANQLGIEKAVPKRILDLMNVDGLTRENVASHLQKYRLYLKRISTVASQQANMAAALGIKDSTFIHTGSFDGLGDHRTFSGPRLVNVALSPYTSGGMLGRLNSPANVNLHNLTASALVLPPSGQNPSLLRGFPSPLGLDRLPQNTVPTCSANFSSADSQRMFRTGVGGSNSLLNGIQNNPVVMQNGFGNQLTHEMASFDSPGKYNESWQNMMGTSKIHTNPLLSAEPFHSQLPLSGSRDDSCSNGPYVQNNSIGFSSGVALPPFEDSRDMQCQSRGEQRQSYAHSSQISANCIMANVSRSLASDNGILNRKIDMIINGRPDASASTSMQRNENEKAVTESTRRSNEEFLLDPLDELMNAMIKRDQGETTPNCDFGFGDFCFGAEE